MFEDPTPEERPFVEAVCAAPADLEPRLIFADWLEEQGDPRAEFLRDSILIEQTIRGVPWLARSAVRPCPAVRRGSGDYSADSTTACSRIAA